LDDVDLPLENIPIEFVAFDN